MSIRSNNANNPLDRKHELFKRLTRLFSGPLVSYKAQVEKTLRRRQLDKYTRALQSSDGKHFKKQSFNLYDALRSATFVNVQRHQRYSDFNEMDNDAYMASCLDIYADEMCTYSKLQPMLTITCANEEIKEVLKVLYRDVLNVECNLPGWCRTMCKYGDYFMFLDIDDSAGIKRGIALPSNEVERLEGEDKTNPDYVQFQLNAGGLTLENWQVAHFRILGTDKYQPYGCCHKFDTRVLMQNGVKEIKDIKVGDLIYSFDTKQQKKVSTRVLDIVCSGEKECLKIKTRHNFLETSAEHRIMCFSNELDFYYKNTDEIRIGDLLVINKNVDDGEIIPIIKTRKQEPNYSGYWNNINLIPDYVTEEFAQLFGFLIGDGWVLKHHSSICFATGIYEEINEYYKSLLERYSGRTCLFQAGKVSCGKMVCNSKMLTTILKNMGFEGKFNTKRLPEWIFRASKSIRESFLEGLYESDGSSFEDKWCVRYSIEMSNEQLIKDIKTLVQSLGYKSSNINSRKRDGRFVVDHYVAEVQRSYYFYYYKKPLTQFKRHENINRISNEYVLEPVVSIESSGVHETYDIHVENENHNFISNGIVTHNSVLDAARRVFRQLILLEDAIIAYRIVRAPERKVFYLDVGNIPPQDVESFMQKAMTQMKRSQIADPTTGRVDLRYQPMSVENDYFLPVRGTTSATRIEPLPGGQFVGDIEDIKYIRDKLFAAVKVPISYISRGDGANEDQSSLSMKDIRFARTIQRLQKSVVSELTKIGLIHLYILGYRGEDLLSFSLALNNPSKIAELQELEHWKTKFDVAAAATEGFFSRAWIAERIFNLSQEELLKNQREMYYDRWLDSQFEAISSAGEGGGGGGDLEGLSSPDMSPDASLENPEDEVTPEEESVLLAAPGKRDEPYLTPGAKGKLYFPETYDKRPAGARTRHEKSKYGAEAASNTTRNVFKGLSGLSSLGHGIANEGVENKNNLLMESKIHTTSYEVKQLLEKLEIKIGNKNNN